MCFTRIPSNASATGRAAGTGTSMREPHHLGPRSHLKQSAFDALGGYGFTLATLYQDVATYTQCESRSYWRQHVTLCTAIDGADRPSSQAAVRPPDVIGSVGRNVTMQSIMTTTLPQATTCRYKSSSSSHYSSHPTLSTAASGVSPAAPNIRLHSTTIDRSATTLCLKTQQACTMKNRSLAAFTALFLAGVGCVGADWIDGRATFYGNEPWYWSIHHGSCMFGYQWPDQMTGWDVTALSDAHPDYAGSCGSCYEIKCKSGYITDGYGESIGREGACINEGASVVVRTTDTCPCQYGNNYYSNKRWCCGDMPHFDMSVWAFQKLTDMKHGVIPIQYRKVDCYHWPDNKAYNSWGSFPGEFPPISEASNRGDFDWYKYFPGGGYLNSHANDGSGMVSTDEYLRRVGLGGSSSYSSFQYGKKK